MPRGKRIIPKAGFYIYKMQPGDNFYFNEVIYTTGERGGGGHKYFREINAPGEYLPKDLSKFFTLTWTCVPSVKELEEKYLYVETIEKAADFYNMQLTTVQ